MVRLSDLHLRAARARIAAAAGAPVAPAELGGVVLRDEQRRTVGRVTDALLRQRGCLLADEVGQGKTFVALAVARRWNRPLVIVPASLRRTWMAAMHRARVDCTIATHESLSRGRLPDVDADFVIVDESHRFRSPRARRYSALVTITAQRPVLLLSATPLQNRTRDLAAQLALFLGGDAFRRAPQDLTRHVIRRERSEMAALPIVAPPRWVHPSCDDGPVLRALLALPPPARPLDGGDGGALRAIGLVRAWTSSRAALRATLRGRQRTATAIEQSLAAGLVPTRREVESWGCVGGDVQLVLAPVMVEHSANSDERSLLSAALTAEHTGLSRLAMAFSASADPDVARVDALRAVRAAHPRERILAFSEFASTVRAYFALMRSDSGVAMLTAAEARIATGRIQREALLARFAPIAQGVRAPPEHERVTLLLATDVLSEGLNLQDASVVVHLDLPWNPLRLAQRLGRVRRPGGASIVYSYLFAPPADADLLLDVESRLRSKLARAERTIGATIPIVPALGRIPDSGPAADRSPDRQCGYPSAATLGALAERLARWQRAGRERATRSLASPDGAPFIAAATSARRGWLAALDDGRLLAALDGAAPNVARSPPMAAELAEGAGRPLASDERVRSLAEVQRWLDGERVRLFCGVAPWRSTPREAVERQIARVMRATPRHARATTLALVARLRDALPSVRSLGAERELEALLADARHADDGHRWLQRALSIASRASHPPASGEPSAPRVVAIISLGDSPDRPSRTERRP